MALRPFVTAGVAFAAAGAVAATVAIAPPMSAGEVRVAMNTEVALNANIADLINTYFGQFPGDPDNAGTIHAAGVLQQLLQNANENDPRGTAVIDSFFESGASDVLRLLLTRDYIDQNDPTPFQINTFFNSGAAEVLRYRLLAYQADPTLRAQINTFFGDSVNADGSENIAQNGFQGLFYDALVGTGLSVQQRQILDTFYNAPTVFNSQAVPITIPVLQRVEDPPGSGTFKTVPVLDAQGVPVTSTFTPILDANGNPTFNAAGQQIFSPTDVIGFRGNPNPARRGSFGVLYNTIRNTGLSADQQATLDQFWDGGITEVTRVRLVDATADPTQKQTINDYFEGGVTQVVKRRLVDGAADQRSKDLWTEYFDNGITGVVRYLLTGPLPEEEDATPPAEEQEETTLLAARQEVADTDTQSAELEGGKPTPVPDELSSPLSRKAAAPAPQPAPVPQAVPAAEPVADTPPARLAKNDGEPASGTNVKDGNKVVPVIILPGGNSANRTRGGGAWGWDGLADRINTFVKGVQGANGNGAAAETNESEAGNSDGADE